MKLNLLKSGSSYMYYVQILVLYYPLLVYPCHKWVKHKFNHSITCWHYASEIRRIIHKASAASERRV